MLILMKQRKLYRGYGGKRNIKTAQKLREKLKKLGVSFDEICTDN
ncbi:hypothetical protein CCAND93_2390001 [Capnocytophaga canis]|uniref:Uncharacterized protein n=1 Tax=Capnocytophaga canis TaxID=1848903 RepID=A0A0B7IQT1_9FLAO|nr:hypothetical protein CCAND93_2390001 [Capnocytophaga canis]